MDLTDQIAEMKRKTEAARVQLLKTFEFVPGDKLDWSPSSTARSALRIVAHCGAANVAFATMIRGEGWALSFDPQEAWAQIRAGGSDVSTREAAVKSVEESTAAVLAALDRVSPELAETAVKTAFGPLPFAFCMTFPSEHMGGHARQIDYLQTIWGDVEDHPS
jgi:hypothetical protein